MMEKLEGMRFTVEELHEMYKRVFLNGVMSYQRDNPEEMLTRELCFKFAEDADRMCIVLDQKGMTK